MNTVDRVNEVLERAETAAESDPRDILLKYYEVAGPDYSYWSTNMNMHFGFWRLGIGPWNRERMLEQMSHEAFDRFGLANSDAFRALDAGCGVGATIRTGIKRFTRALFDGITVVPWQVERAKELTPDRSRVTYSIDDFQRANATDESYDVCYSIEAAVHGEGLDKKEYAKEMFRLLKPGGTLVIVDCFLRQVPDSFGPITRRVYQAACNGWAVKEMAHLPSFTKSLNEAGFEPVTFEDISWRVAPSVFHVPFVSLRYFFQALFQRRQVARESWRHVVACLTSCYLGCQLDKFRYGIVVARKPLS